MHAAHAPQGLELRLKVAKGSVVKEIAAESADHDLLVMHSTRPAQRFRMRSRRTKAIVRAAKCNVLLMQAY